MADHVGQQLGNYRLVRLIGRGGFADVYLGEHVYLHTQVAVKLLQARVADNELDGFLIEARTIAHLVHPHIVRVMDFGVERESPFLVMDYAPNGTLRQRHPGGTRLLPATIVPYVRQVADALQYAHDEKFIHRDIKPENMLLGRRDEILLSDFGIALIAQSSRYQHTSDVAGTVSYMAPEQIQGKPRPASDQYALAVVVYEWLSGDRPFHGSFSEVCAQHMFASPPPLREKILSVSPAVEEVVLTALAKDPSQRFKSVQAFANALEQASRLESRGPAMQVGSLAFSETTRADEGQATVAEEHEPEAPRVERAFTGSQSGKMRVWRAWGIGKRQVLAMLLGVILYGAVDYAINFWYKQDSPLAVTSISAFNVSVDSGMALFMSVALIIPLFFGSIAGPWVGLITVLAGTYLGSLLAGYNAPSDYYGASWTWFAGQLLIGFIAGLALLKTQGRYTTGRAIAYGVVICAAGILAGTLFATFADIGVSGITTDEAWTRFLSLTLPAAIDVVLLPLLLFAYATIAERLRIGKFGTRA